MIKEFTYTSSKGTKDRKVFVIKDTEKYIEGIDLNLLTKEDADIIANKYKDFKPLSVHAEKVMLEDFNPAWTKAYRQFSKSKISN